MVFIPSVSALFILSLAFAGQTLASGLRARDHHALAARSHYNVVERGLEAASVKLHRRRSCRAPSSSSSSSSSELVETTSTIQATTLSPAAKPTIVDSKPKTTTTKAKTTEKHTTTTSTTAAASTNTVSTASGSGHQFTLTNKCSSAVKPVIASTACGYSPRCADASTAPLPSVGSLPAGKTTTVTIPNDFVGRIFAQNGSCGDKGEDCTMLEFNLDADSFYTPNSYDISNIQGFTQSISLGAAGCDTVTCTSPSCSCNNAYPIGDMTGCGSDLPVRACGKGNIAFTVVFCP
ncbi:hypothetical protein C8F01DRAFT_1001268 [Mycena amicta]|nr:hypothetical protein C8F01DRAFT_1001268 [Mycena amicta]